MPIHPKHRIVCAGRTLDEAGRPAGQPCGRRAHDGCMCCDGWCHRAGCAPAPHVDQHVSVLVQVARAGGWRIGPARADGTYPATCPRCAKPDPALVRICTELAASVGAGRSRNTAASRPTGPTPSRPAGPTPSRPTGPTPSH